MILIDTGPIVAFFDASDDYHNLCLKALSRKAFYSLSRTDLTLR